MVKRLYLLMSLVVVICMVIAVSSTVAGQKEKQKEKTENKEQKKERQWTGQDDASRQFFMLPQGAGEGGYLGVYLEEVTADRVKELGLTEERGAIVMKVVEGSPAARAGLKENDVIVTFNGRRIESVREMQRLLGETPAERNVSIEVIRGGNHQTLAATLSKKSQGYAAQLAPDWQGSFLQGEEARKRAKEFLSQQDAFKNLPDFGNFTFVNPGEFTFFKGGRLGAGVESMTEQLSEYFGVKEGRGVLVTQVNENSAASKAGLKAGDVIIAIDNEKIDSVNALLTALSKKEEGTIAVKIIRNRAEQTINVTLEKPPVRSRAGSSSSASSSA
jgi:C-terminal processing protease CtpA/Prc